MKLIVQIPCFNEELTIARTLDCIPREVEGFDQVEILIIDDGSNDETVKKALQNGANHVVRHTHNMGLAVAFSSGLAECLEQGADVIVNTDADNQYNAEDISLLVKPILDRSADIVVGERPIKNIEHFSFLKKVLQRLGSWVTRYVSKTDVKDAPSGFRAISRYAARNIIIFNNYTYTLESIIQAGHKNIAIKSVPIRVNEDLRPSKLVKSIFSYIRKSIAVMVRIFIIYRPFAFFGTLGGILVGAGILGCVRFLYYYFSEGGDGHIQSVVFSVGLIFAGYTTLLVAFLADLLAANRKLLEDVRYKNSLIMDKLKEVKR